MSQRAHLSLEFRTFQTYFLKCTASVGWTPLLGPEAAVVILAMSTGFTGRTEGKPTVSASAQITTTLTRHIHGLGAWVRPTPGTQAVAREVSTGSPLITVSQTLLIGADQTVAVQAAEEMPSTIYNSSSDR